MACSASFGRSAIVTARGDVYVMECYSRTTVKTFPGHIRQVVAHVRGATYVTDDSRVHDPRDIIAFSGLGHVPVLMVACGKEHTAALSESGHVFTFGRGCEGQLGRGAGTHDESPAFLQPDKFADERIVFIACGDYFTAALSAARVYTWGNNRFGQLGLGTVVPSTVPQRVDALAFGASAPVFLAAGQDFMAAVTPDGSMYTWGCNRHGQLGRGFDDRVATPQRVWFVLKDPEAQREPAVMAACGNAHTLLLTTKGEVFASGMGRAGQLGLGDNWQRHWFQRVCVGASGGQEVATVAADLNVSMAVTRSGDVYQVSLWCYLL
jgi:alpha-tubulin suppressor-like RCC1 family protein